MTGFSVHEFGGVIPRTEQRDLPHSAGSTAVNCKLWSGSLRSWQLTTAINTPTKSGTATIQSIYRMYGTGTYSGGTSTNAWLSWPSDVDCARGPVAGDTAFRLYFTGDTTTASNSAAGPRKTNLLLATQNGTDYPHDWLEMGVPAPGSAPTVTSTGGTSTVLEARVYLYTYVTGSDAQGTLWAEEGPPSPGGTCTGKIDDTWTVASLSTGTTGKYAFSGAIKRIYRTLTDASGNTNYFLALDQVPIATTSTNDTVADANLGVICPTFQNGVVGSAWIGPPSNLTGLTLLPNGILAGFSGNLICFCVPFQPHAWPTMYQLATNYPIVGMGHFGQTLIVTTLGFPYAVIGVAPGQMAMQMIEDDHPCVSKRGIVSFSFGVAWPTPDGLALAGVAGASNIIEPFMKRDEWQAQCFPATITARQYQNVYFGFFSNGMSGLNFVFDKINQRGPVTFGNFAASAVWNDPETSTLYLVQNGQIVQWDADSLNPSPFDWKSKYFVLPKPVNFGAIQVDANYGLLQGAGAATTAAKAADFTTNTLILGTANQDEGLMTAWAATSSYTTGACVVSVDRIKQAVCIKLGTSSTLEPTWPSTMGGTATDGTTKWVRSQQLQGVTKGSIRGAVLRDHIQWTTSDPVVDGTAGNQWGFPLRGSLLQGGAYPNYLANSLQLSVYAQLLGTSTDLSLVWEQNLTDRTVQRLPAGFKSDTWAFELSGTLPVRYFKVSETAAEIGAIP